jgi:putative glutathione S-transferase
MGRLVDGKWVVAPIKTEKGRFVRRPTTFRKRVVAAADAEHPVAANRYHLYVSWACPWAHRTLIVRKLRKLEDVVSLSVVNHFMGDDGWEFTDDDGAIPDSVNKTRFLRDIYVKADACYNGRVTVPVLWDKEKSTIVNNESREIVRMFDTAFMGLGDPNVCFYRENLSDQIEETINAIYEPINNGVYKSGFARRQDAYEEAVGALFEGLGHWDEVLGTQRYLCGDIITEADWFLFTTLIRFDLVYHTHFKCNVRRIDDYSNLSGFMRELYQVPGVAETCNFDHIKRHYYASHLSVNPTGVVARGPDLRLDRPHGRG